MSALLFLPVGTTGQHWVDLGDLAAGVDPGFDVEAAIEERTERVGEEDEPVVVGTTETVEFELEITDINPWGLALIFGFGFDLGAMVDFFLAQDPTMAQYAESIPEEFESDLLTDLPLWRRTGLHGIDT